MSKSQLTNVYLFKGLSSEEITALSRITQTDKLKTGQSLFGQGDKATAMYVVQYGTVKVVHSGATGDDVQVATLGSGSHLGEMGFVDGKTRSGSATALEECEIIRIDYTKLNELFAKNPKLAAHFYKQIAVFLCGRLENANRDLNFARTKAMKAA